MAIREANSFTGLAGESKKDRERLASQDLPLERFDAASDHATIDSQIESPKPLYCGLESSLHQHRLRRAPSSMPEARGVVHRIE